MKRNILKIAILMASWVLMAQGVLANYPQEVSVDTLKKVSAKDGKEVTRVRPYPYFEVRAGFGIGGTVPFPLPPQMRKIEGFKPLGNFSVQTLANMPFNEHWEMLMGLRFERKAMTADATVKDYNMSIQDDDGGTITGRWTGFVSMSADQIMLTMPLEATYNITPKGCIRAGLYFSYVTRGKFYGEVKNGYLREGNPTGAKIEIDEEPQTFEFNDDMRRFQWGWTVGGEWRLYKAFSFFADLDWGLNNVFVKDFETISFDMFPIFGTVGIGYSFK